MAVFSSVAALDRKERNVGLNLICYFYPDTVYIIVLSCLTLNTYHLLGKDFLDGVQGNQGRLLYSIFYGYRKQGYYVVKSTNSV